MLIEFIKYRTKNVFVPVAPVAAVKTSFCIKILHISQRYRCDLLNASLQSS